MSAINQSVEYSLENLYNSINSLKSSPELHELATIIAVRSIRAVVDLSDDKKLVLKDRITSIIETFKKDLKDAPSLGVTAFKARLIAGLKLINDLESLN